MKLNLVHAAAEWLTIAENVPVDRADQHYR